MGSHDARIIVIFFCCFFFSASTPSMAWKYGPLFALASLVAAEDYTLHEFPGGPTKEGGVPYMGRNAPLDL